MSGAVACLAGPDASAVTAVAIHAEVGGALGRAGARDSLRLERTSSAGAAELASNAITVDRAACLTVPRCLIADQTILASTCGPRAGMGAAACHGYLAEVVRTTGVGWARGIDGRVSAIAIAVALAVQPAGRIGGTGSVADLSLEDRKTLPIQHAGLLVQGDGACRAPRTGLIAANAVSHDVGRTLVALRCWLAIRLLGCTDSRGDRGIAVGVADTVSLCAASLQASRCRALKWCAWRSCKLRRRRTSSRP